MSSIEAAATVEAAGTSGSGQVTAMLVSQVSKSFAGVTVLDNAALAVRAGSVHALIGHNGSGKSTLVKALAGFHAPDEPVAGEVFGQPFQLGDHASAAAAGLRFVHQDLGLVEDMNAVDNLALGTGYPRALKGLVHQRHAAQRAREAMTDLGYEIDVSAPVGSLSPAERTGVAIARALQGWSGKPAVVVMDEPTAAMPAAEVERLFQAVRRLRDQGLGILYVSHHLDEILALGDDVTALRNGRVVLSRRVAGLAYDDLVAAIVGRTVLPEAHVRASHGHPAPDSTRESVLTVSNLRTNSLTGIDFTVHRGEILGFAGIVGSGRDELVPAISGATAHSGTVVVGSERVRPNRPKAATRAGIGVVPSERRRAAVLPTFPAAWNLTISGVGRYSTWGLLNRQAENSDVNVWFEQLDINPRDPQAPVLTLSGGNQQKVIVGRWLRRSPRVLVLDEPTQGVDVGAQAMIYRLIRRAADAGSAVLIGSSDGDELAAICDRVLVLSRGTIIAELIGDQIDAERIDSLVLESAGVRAS